MKFSSNRLEKGKYLLDIYNVIQVESGEGWGGLNRLKPKHVKADPLDSPVVIGASFPFLADPLPHLPTIC